MRIGLGILLAAFMSVPRISAAQTSGPPALPRVYVDVNLFGYADLLGDAKTFQNYAIKFGEVATFTATYPEPSHSAVYPLHVGGGFMLSRYYGVGASYSRLSRSSVVDLSATVPDPTFFEALATGRGTTGTALSRHESAIHISLAVVPLRTPRMEVRLIVGPSFYMLSGDMVREVEYAQTSSDVSPHNAITVNGASTGAAKGSAVGYHLGGDFTYFVHRAVGIAGGIRYGRATVAVNSEPLSNLKQEFLVGGTTVFLGLRFRFGPNHE